MYWLARSSLDFLLFAITINNNNFLLFTGLHAFYLRFTPTTWCGEFLLAAAAAQNSNYIYVYMCNDEFEF